MKFAMHKNCADYLLIIDLIDKFEIIIIILCIFF